MQNRIGNHLIESKSYRSGARVGLGGTGAHLRIAIPDDAGIQAAPSLGRCIAEKRLVGQTVRSHNLNIRISRRGK